MVGVQPHIPTERPGAVIIIGDNDIASPNGTLTNRIDLTQGALDIGGGMGIDHVLGGHIEIDIGEHIGKAHGQEEEQRHQTHAQQTACRQPGQA